MTKDLTEAWKKGELEDGEYYVKLIGDKVYILAREDNHWCEFGWKNTEEENKKLKELLKVIRGYLINGCDVEDEIRICEEIDEVLK